MAAGRLEMRAKKSLQNQKAAHLSWAATADRTARTRPGNEAALAKVAASVDPEGLMSPEARELAIESAIKAHYVDLALRSAAVRRARSRRANGSRVAERGDDDALTAP